MNKKNISQVIKKIAYKRAERKINYKIWKKWKNKLAQKVPKSKARSRASNQKFTSTCPKVRAPENFSFNTNAEEVVAFINELKAHYDRRKEVFVNLKHVTTLDYGAILSLLSIMVKFKAQHIPFTGNLPLNDKCKKLLQHSSFFKYLYKQFSEEDRYNLKNGGKNEIVTHAWKNVDSSLSAELIEHASRTIWGESRRCQGVQRVLIELMQNTNNHASNENKGEKHWWLHVSHDEENNKVYFAFVDFGIGVFKSLNKKTHESKWFGWVDKISKLFGSKSDEEIMQLIMSGDFHKTVTGKYYRGKGLPGIAEAEKRKQIENLKIVTNHVNADVSKNSYSRISSSFNGMYVFWELNHECQSNAIDADSENQE